MIKSIRRWLIGKLIRSSEDAVIACIEAACKMSSKDLRGATQYLEAVLESRPPEHHNCRCAL